MKNNLMLVYVNKSIVFFITDSSATEPIFSTLIIMGFSMRRKDFLVFMHAYKQENFKAK